MLLALPLAAVLVAVLVVTNQPPAEDVAGRRPRLDPAVGRRAIGRLPRRLALFITLLGLSACGEGRLNDFLFGPTTATHEVPSPAPTASPSPAPESPATPIPTPTPPDDGHPDNTAAVAEVTGRVFFVECGGTEIPGSEYASEAPVGCRLHLDCTPRDAYHQPTRPRGGPAWSWTNGLTAGGARGDYTPALTIQAPGTFTAHVEIDGVHSNVVVVRFH